MQKHLHPVTLQNASLDAETQANLDRITDLVSRADFQSVAQEIAKSQHDQRWSLEPTSPTEEGPTKRDLFPQIEDDKKPA